MRFIHVFAAIFGLAVYATLPASLGPSAIAQGKSKGTEADIAKAPQVELETGGHVAQVARTLFTPDSKSVVTVGFDRTIRYWDVESGEMQKAIRPHYFIVPETKAYGVGVSPDRTLLAIREKLRRAIFMNVVKGDVERLVPIQALEESFILSLAFSPDGKRLALGTGSLTKGGRVLIVDPVSGKLLQEFPQNRINVLAWSPDGQRLVAAMGALGRTVYLLNTAGKGTLENTFEAEGETSRCVAWYRTGTGVWIGTDNGIQVWDLKTPQAKRTFPIGPTNFIELPAKGTTMLTAGEDFKSRARISKLDMKSGQETTMFTTLRPAPASVALSPDGKTVAAVCGPLHVLHMWQYEDGKEIHNIKGVGGALFAAGWSPTGSSIAWGRYINFDAKGFLERRPLQNSFDLREHTFAANKADLAASKRAVLTGPNGTLFADQKYPVVVRNGQKINLQPFGGARISHCATHLSQDRIAIDGFLSLQFLDAKTGERLGKWLPDYDDEMRDMAPSPNGKLLLTASLDQRLRIYNVAVRGQEKLLLTAFFTKGGWIAWTPDGYYAATPGGERRMGWVIDNGPRKLKTFYPADRFRKQLYRPDIVKLVIEKGNVKDAVAAANAALKKEGKVIPQGVAEVEKLLPPSVSLRVTDVKLPKVTVQATATASGKDQPITGLRLLIDGRSVPGSDGSADFPRGVMKADPPAWTITLPGEKASGPYKLSVLARSPDSSNVSAPVDVSYVNPSKLPALHILAVGVNDYDDASLKLQFAAHDARALTDAFTKSAKPGGLYAKVSSTLLVDKDAKRDRILAALAEIRKNVKAQDLVVVSFACHGVKDKTGFYLLTVEAKLDDLAKTALSGDVLRKSLADIPCQVLLLLDACHSAGFGEGRKLAKMGLRPATDDATRAMTDDEVGVAVLCAAMGHEKAEEKDGNGLFTKAIVQALAGVSGVPQRNRKLYIHHLHTYVFDAVSDRSNDRQHPFLSLPWIVESFPVTQFSASSAGKR